MPSIRLNDISLRGLKAPSKGQTDYWDRTLPSFGCRVSQGGSKTFLLKRDNRRITIGRYPIISLQDARREAKRLLAEFTLGRLHPLALAHSEAVRLFLEDKEKSKRARTVADYKRLLNKHFSFKGQLGAVTNAQVSERLEKLKDVPAEHNHARTAAVIFYNWCIKRRYITANPVVGISAFKRPRRSRVLTDDELKSIWQTCAIETSELPKHFRTIVHLLILMGQRETETAALHREWIKDGSITLPETITKNHNEHTFPVGRMAEGVLAAQKADGLLFPARTAADKPFCGWGKAKASLDRLCGVVGWTLHDIRRTFRTNLGKLGVAPHISERLVNHIAARTDMERTYDWWTYMPEMREAMNKWEAHISAILSTNQCPNGIALRNEAA